MLEVSVETFQWRLLNRPIEVMVLRQETHQPRVKEAALWRDTHSGYSPLGDVSVEIGEMPLLPRGSHSGRHMCSRSMLWTRRGMFWGTLAHKVEDHNGCVCEDM